MDEEFWLTLDEYDFGFVFTFKNYLAGVGDQSYDVDNIQLAIFSNEILPITQLSQLKKHTNDIDFLVLEKNIETQYIPIQDNNDYNIKKERFQYVNIITDFSDISKELETKHSYIIHILKI